jgi:hypothetical protein
MARGSLTLTWGPYDGFWTYHDNGLRHWSLGPVAFTYVPGAHVDDFLANLTIQPQERWP